MTFTGMSAGYPYGVGPFPEGGEDEFRTHPAGARYSYDTDIRRILKPADTCKVGSTIAAPIA